MISYLNVWIELAQGYLLLKYLPWYCFVQYLGGYLFHVCSLWNITMTVKFCAGAFVTSVLRLNLLSLLSEIALPVEFPNASFYSQCFCNWHPSSSREGYLNFDLYCLYHFRVENTRISKGISSYPFLVYWNLDSLSIVFANFILRTVYLITIRKHRGYTPLALLILLAV